MKPIAAVAACVVLAGFARGEDPPSIEAVLARARESYLAAPFATAVGIEITDSAGRVERSAIEAYVDPGEEGEIVSIAVRADPLRAWASGTELIITHAAEPRTWWGCEIAAPLEGLTSTLPPLPIPQFAVLDASSPWTPVTPEVEWQTVLEDQSGVSWVLVGRSGEMAVRATFDRESGELLAFAASGPATAPVVGITLAMRELPADDPARWRPDVGVRERRSTLADLVDPSPTLGPGEPLPPVPWVMRDGRSWSMRNVLASPEAGSRGVAAVALILLDASRSGETDDAVADIRAAADAIRVFQRERVRQTVIRPHASNTGEVLIVPALVFSGQGFDPARFERLAAELADIAPESPGVVWTSPARATLEAMAPGARAALCLIDRHGRIGAVVALDGVPGASDDLIADVHAALDATLEVP